MSSRASTPAVDLDRQRRWIETPPAQPPGGTMVASHPSPSAAIVGHPRGGLPRVGRVGSPEAAQAAARRSQLAEIALHEQIRSSPNPSRAITPQDKAPPTPSEEQALQVPRGKPPSAGGSSRGLRSRGRSPSRPNSRTGSRSRSRRPKSRSLT